MACITVLSDFGSASGYPAAMKGVILSLYPSAQIVDISHDVERHHIRAGAFLLWMVAPYFPEKTVHCAVVDPGVGSSRRPLVIESGGQFFVGPDNGLLIPAAERLGKPKVHHIQNEKYLRPEVSRTFHGRDIFAPVAAHIAEGLPIGELGPQITDFVKLSFGEGRRAGRVLEGEIIYIDTFGNVITNIPGTLLEGIAPGSLLVVEVSKKVASARAVQTYAEGDQGELLVIVGSHGQVEIATNLGSAAARLRAHVGEAVRISPGPSHPHPHPLSPPRERGAEG
jgi:S-adenosyl-L-methionine hydrolase (adenosine-forming)